MNDGWNEPGAQAPAAWRSRWAQRENERRLSQHAAADQRWQADLHDLDQMLGAARTFEGLPAHSHSPLVLKRGERIFTALPMVTLIEGAASADRLPMDARFSWGATRTTRTTGGGPGQAGTTTVPAGMRAADSGPVTLTDRRIVFHGSNHAREWAFTKLLGLANPSDGPYTVLQVSNRQKPSGVLYPPSSTPAWRFHLALALAVFSDHRQALVTGLERERHDLVAMRPVLPVAALPEEAPAHLALTHAVRTLYLGRPGQRTGRRIAQGTAAGVLTLLALSIIAALSSPPPSTVSAGLAFPSTSPSSSPATQAPSREPPPPAVAAVTSAVAKPASPRPLAKVPTQRPRPSAGPRSRPTTHATTRATPKARPKPAPKPAPSAPKLCGAPSNPWGYTFCGGAYITSPPSSFCSYFDCIQNFPNGKGYVEQCADGTFSKSGGRQGACSYHGGERRPLLRS